MLDLFRLAVLLQCTSATVAGDVPILVGRLVPPKKEKVSAGGGGPGEKDHRVLIRTADRM